MKYYTDSTIFKFNTRVKTVEEKEDGVYVELEESYFYPESGGQLKDEGTINGKEVMDLMIIEGVLYHKLASFSGLTLNMQVNCIIDENVREAHTVTHTAQHVFSAVLKDGYNLNTIGFHMGKQITTIDLDGEISQDMLIEVEDRVNKIIRDDLKVKTYFRTLKEAQRLPLRKEIKDLENVQIVQIGDIDYSGCGGTHVASLKEIQLFKVVDMEKYKGGLRISFAAGRKAFDYIKELEVTMRLLKEELNTSIDEMPYRVRRLKEEKAGEHLRAENHQKEMVSFMANNYDEDVIVEKTTYDEEMIKALGKEIMALEKMAVFYTEERKVYLFTGKKLHAKRVLDEAKAGLDFRGGAGAHFGQGIFEKEEDLLTFISNLYGVFLKLEV